MSVTLAPAALPQRSTQALVSIYALCEPSGEVRYVGKAVDPEARLRRHLEPAKLVLKSHKNSWLRSLLAADQQPVLRVLVTVPQEEVDEAERYWIRQLCRMGCRLTNGTDGGDGGAVTDPAARERIRAAHSGTRASAETRARMSASAKARCADPAERARLRTIGNRRPPVRHGEANNACLSEEQVREIRHLHKGGVPGTELARRFGVTPANVSLIVRRRAWTHLPEEK